MWLENNRRGTLGMAALPKFWKWGEETPIAKEKKKKSPRVKGLQM